MLAFIDCLQLATARKFSHIPSSVKAFIVSFFAVFEANLSFPYREKCKHRQSFHL